MDKTKLDGTQPAAEDPRLLFDIPAGGITLGQLAQAVRQSLMPTGALLPFGGASAPLGYLLCDGSAVSRATYSALFAAVGTAFGVGDGSTTFNLPDMRGRVPVGKNAGTFTPLGSTGGEETHVLTAAELASHTHTGPSHTHTINDHNHGITDTGHTHDQRKGAGSASSQTHNSSAATFSSSSITVGDSTSSVSTGISIGNATVTEQAAGTGNTGATGSGTAHNNLQPYQTVNYIIKT